MSDSETLARLLMDTIGMDTGSLIAWWPAWAGQMYVKVRHAHPESESKVWHVTYRIGGEWVVPVAKDTPE
jgi:hypothetical protein